MRIVVTGSLAYDYIMDFPGYFHDHLIADRAQSLSVSFLVDSMRKLRGGVAGNIAYNLALLGEPPLLLGTAGHDFAEYRAWLESHHIDTSAVCEIDGEFTSSCFINTDRSNNQLVAFYAGAMAYWQALSLLPLGLTSNDLVVISPTYPEAIERAAVECRQLGVPFVFDPGKQTPRLNAQQIQAGLDGARVLVGNEYEFAMMANMLGCSEQDLIERAPLTVMTRGEQGARFYVRENERRVLDVPAAKVARVADPTGAGDAFLAGLVFGIVRDLPLEITGRIATLTAAFTIEARGGQEHRFAPGQFVERYQQAFGEPLPAGIFEVARATSINN